MEEAAQKRRRCPGREEARVCPAEGWAYERPRAGSGLVGAGVGSRGSRALGSGPSGPGSLVQKAASGPRYPLAMSLASGTWAGSPHSLWQEPSGPWGKLQAKWPPGSRSLQPRTTVARSSAVPTVRGLRAVPPRELAGSSVAEQTRGRRGQLSWKCPLGPLPDSGFGFIFKAET